MIRIGACFLTVCLSILGGAQAASLDEIRARGTLRACFALLNPALVQVIPEGCSKDCTYEGFLVDQVSILAATLGEVTVEHRVVGWSEQFEDSNGRVRRADPYVPRLLAEDACDIYATNLARLPWRLSKMNIVPLFENRMIAIVRSERLSEFGGLAALAGKSIAVTPNSSFHTWMLNKNTQEFRDNPVKILPASPVEPLEMVRRGVADFTLTDADIAVFAAKTFHPELSPAFAIGPLQELGWGLHPGNASLHGALIDFVRAQKEEPHSLLNRAWQHHLGVTLNEFEVLVNTLPGAERRMEPQSNVD